MSRRNSPPAIGLSMLDLVSNALAAVIILFFILASVAEPAYPPLRIIGTLIIQFEKIKTDSNDFSLTYTKYNGPLKIEDKSGKNLNDTFWFGNKVSILNAQIWEFQYYHKSDYALKLSSKMPPLRSYQSDVNGYSKHVIIMHDPPAGIWNFGFLYTHYKTLPDTVPTFDSVHYSIRFYNDQNTFSNDSSLHTAAPSSSVNIQLEFDEKGIKGNNFFITNKDTI